MKINLRAARQEAKEEITRLLAEGQLSYEEIAFKTGCSVSLVYVTAKRENLRRCDVQTKQEVQ